MSNVPSIKGTVFIRAVEDILKLVSKGTLSRSELQRRLRPADAKVLDQPVAPSSWYDVQIYGRLLEFLRDVEGEGSNEYLRERGARSAELLRQAGLYQQMEYLNRTQAAQQTDARARYLAFGRDLRLLTTMHGSILNFGRQLVKEDPEHADRYLMVYEEVALPGSPLLDDGWPREPNGPTARATRSLEVGAPGAAFHRVSHDPFDLALGGEFYVSCAISFPGRLGAAALIQAHDPRGRSGAGG